MARQERHPPGTVYVRGMAVQLSPPAAMALDAGSAVQDACYDAWRKELLSAGQIISWSARGQDIFPNSTGGLGWKAA